MKGKLLGGCSAVVLALLNLASVGCAVMPALVSVIERFTKAVKDASGVKGFPHGGELIRMVMEDLLDEEWMIRGLRSLEETLASPTEREKYFTVAESNYLRHMLKDRRALRSERIRRGRSQSIAVAEFGVLCSVSRGPSSEGPVHAPGPRLLHPASSEGPSSLEVYPSPPSRCGDADLRHEYLACRTLVHRLRLSLESLLGSSDTSLLPDFARLLYLEWQVIEGTEEEPDNDATAVSNEKRFLEKFKEAEALIKKAFFGSNLDMIDKRLEDARKGLNAVYAAPPMTTDIAKCWRENYFWLAVSRARDAMLTTVDEENAMEDDLAPPLAHVSEEEKKKRRLLNSAWCKLFRDDFQWAPNKALLESDAEDKEKESPTAEITPNEVSLLRSAYYAVHKQTNRNLRVFPEDFDDHREVLIEFTHRISHPPAEDREDTTIAAAESPFSESTDGLSAKQSSASSASTEEALRPKPNSPSNREREQPPGKTVRPKFTKETNRRITASARAICHVMQQPAAASSSESTPTKGTRGWLKSIFRRPKCMNGRKKLTRKEPRLRGKRDGRRQGRGNFGAQVFDMAVKRERKPGEVGGERLGPGACRGGRRKGARNWAVSAV